MIVGKYATQRLAYLVASGVHSCKRWELPHPQATMQQSEKDLLLKTSSQRPRQRLTLSLSRAVKGA